MSSILEKELTQGAIPIGLPQGYQYDAALVESAKAATQQGMIQVANKATEGRAILDSYANTKKDEITAFAETKKQEVSNAGSTSAASAAQSAQAAATSAQAAATSAQAAAQIVNVGVDPTLTVSGSAADSKTVGDSLNLMVPDNIITSTNIWNGEYIDKKIFNYAPSATPVNYEKGLLIGYFPVEENKTYTVANGAYQVGALLFFDSGKSPICGINGVGGNYGNTTNFWPSVAGKVEVSGVGAYRTFKPLLGSGIKYVCWYVTNDYQNTNYIGTHTSSDLITFLSGVQVNEGNVLLPYRPRKVGVIDTVKELYASEGGVKDYNAAKVVLVKNGDVVRFRSHFTETEDMIIRTALHGSQNRAFNFEDYTTVLRSQPYGITSGTLWKGASDDITPVNFNSSYRGANHGDDRGYTLSFSSAHGLTEANIGEVWKDANNKNFLIVEVPDTTTVIGVLLADSMVSNASCFLTDTPVSPLTKSGASKTFVSAVRGQLKPIANHVSVQLFADAKEVTIDGTYDAKCATIVESYDLLYLPAMVTYLQSNVGNNTNASHYSNAITEKYCTVTNTYRFTERGAVTLIQSIEWAKLVNLSFSGMVQSMGIGDYYCVPGTTLNRINQIGTTQINFDKAIWDDANTPPNRFYQFADALTNKGMCIGYNAEIASGRPEVRRESPTAGFIYTSKKLYPKIVSPNSDTTTDIYAVSYRVPLSNTPGAASVGWYHLNDDVYVLIDAQQSNDSYIKLPSEFIGRSMEVVESYGNINIRGEIVTSKGIRIVISEYGSAILKLMK